MIDEIMDIMNQIHYGYVDNDGINITEKDPENWDIEFKKIYHLLEPTELLEKKYGTCYDQVELERKLFEDRGMLTYSYFISTHENEDCIYTHTFLVYEEDNYFYWFEHSWGEYRGVHKYSSLQRLLKDVKEKFRRSHSTEMDSYTFIYEYSKPIYGMNGHEFFEYCENSTLIKVNEPCYFYCILDKDIDSKNGLYCDSAISFFKGLPDKELLTNKNLYRINIKDEEIQKKIQDISYEDEKGLEKADSITISFMENYCPVSFLKKVD